MSDIAREIFVRNLHYFMEQRRITQADICRELGVSSATVSNWYTGQKYPRIDKMQRLADLLGVRLSTLTTESGVDDFKDQERLEALHADPRLGLLFDRERKLPRKDIENILALVDSILEGRDG